ncbi:MAG: hypothetical protein MUQ30_18320 [Anaerolineae bacterium]|nr:hypothetical protein [Anaerolineae bacterium]
MGNEKATATMEYKAIGLDSLSKGSVGLTGLNQGLELVSKAFQLAESAARAADAAIRPIVQTGSQFEQFGIQFETLLGSAAAAEARVKSLFNFASTTPFNLDQVVEAGKTMEAFGIFSEDALRSVGDAAAAFGKDLQETALAVAGAATGELERLKQFGITSARLAQELGHEVRRNTVADLKEIADATIRIFEETAGGGMDRMSKSLAGMISNLQDSWTRFQKIVADAGVFDHVSFVVKTILDNVNKLFGSGDAERFGMVVGETIATAMRAATLALVSVALEVENMAFAVARILDPASKVFGPGPGAFAPLTPAQQKQFGIPVQDPNRGRVTRELLLGIQADLLRGPRGSAGMTIPGPSGPSAANPGGYGAMNPFGIGYGQPGSLPNGLSGSDRPNIIGGAGEASTGTRGDGSMPMDRPVEEIELLVEKETDAAFTVGKAWQDARASISRGWSTMTDSIMLQTMKLESIEKLSIRNIRNAFGEGMRAMLTDFILAQGDRAKAKAAEEAIDAIAALARYDFVSAAAHGAAAAGYAALGFGAAIVAGAIRGGGAEGDQFEGEGSGGGSSTPASGTRQLSRTTGISTQSMTFNITVVHQSAVVYGRDGIAELYQDQIEPLIQESLDLGRIEPPRAA